MAIDKLRLRVKTADGYNAAHLETSADLVVGLTEAIDNEIDTQVPKDLNGFTNNAGYAKTATVNTALAGKLANTATGSATKGIYINSSGAPAAMTYSVNKDVPADAKFTDTTYTAASAEPRMDGTATVGTSAKYAREDHVHPTDSTRASAADVLALYKETEATKELVEGLDSVAMYRTATGDTAIFSDGAEANAKSCVINIKPIQIGSGDPYSSDLSRNLIPMTWENIRAENTVGVWNGNSYSYNGITYRVNDDGNGNIMSITMNGKLSAAESRFYFIRDFTEFEEGVEYIVRGAVANAADARVTVSSIASDWGDGNTFIGQGPEVPKNIFIYVTNTGTISDLTFYPMVSLASDADPTSAHYSNVRPITGISSVTVTRTGKNLLNMTEAWLKSINTAGTWSGKSYALNGVTFTLAVNNDNVVTKITANGTASALSHFYAGIFNFTAGMQGSGCPTGGSRGSSGSYDVEFTTSNNSSIAIDTGTGASINRSIKNGRIILYVYKDYAASNLTFEPMIRNASVTDATFEPYQGASVTVPLVDSNDDPLIVYGGTLNITTGELAVTHYFIVLDGSENWETYGAGTVNQRFAINFTASGLPMSNPKGNMTASHFTQAFKYSGETFGKVYLSALQDYLVICDGGYTHKFSTNLDVNAWLAAQYANGTPVQIAYPLATPQTYQLTPAQISTLAGYNIISANNVTVEVTYRADPALTYANLESTITAAILSLGAGI